MLATFPLVAAILCAQLSLAWSPYPTQATDVVIVSNNDLDTQNLGRDSALFLSGPFTCAEAVIACTQLQESLLADPGQTGLSRSNLTAALLSQDHGVALAPGQRLWISGDAIALGGCATFSVTADSEQSESDVDLNLLPALCTNSAPLARSNVTSYDTSRQIRLPTASAGVLNGYRDKFSFRFLGIKYAESERFQPPTPVEVSAQTERNATEYGPMCAQPPDPDNGHMLRTEEDCLVLNVYTPRANAGTSATDHATHTLPVMVFVHGGGLTTGDSGPFPYNMTTDGYVGNSIANIYDGTNLVSYGGAVLVTVNYRLTAFGWFNASNAAMKDVLLSLQWVQDNIKAFGGDPTKVLLFGESAGALMTRYILGGNPEYTKGLFTSAVLESDFPTEYPFFSESAALDTSLKLAQQLDCASDSNTVFNSSMAECVQGLPASDIVLAAYELDLIWGGAIDGDYILADIITSIEDGQYARVPTIWASNQCELCYFIPAAIPPNSPPSAFPVYVAGLYNTTATEAILNQTTLYPYMTAPSEGNISGSVLTLGQLLTDNYVHCPMAYLSSLETNTTNAGQSYKILFATGLGSPLTPNPATCSGQVCHGDELYWVFATAEIDNLYQPLTRSQLETTREVIRRWTHFTRTGSPEYEGATAQWRPYTGDNELVIADGSETVQPYRVAQCDFVENQVGLTFIVESS